MTETLEQAEERCIAMEGLGDALLANSLFKESTRIFEELANLTENDATRLRAFRKAMECTFQLGDSSHLMELV